MECSLKGVTEREKRYEGEEEDKRGKAREEGDEDEGNNPASF